MDELTIINKLAAWIDRRKYPYQMCRCFIYGWECDYWAMDLNGETREFEIKISRSDYLQDAKKEKHSLDRGANYFYYVCPYNLIQPSEVRKGYGLIYIGEIIQIVKKPRARHERKFSQWQILANKYQGKWWDLWFSKYQRDEITFDEYVDGFKLEDIEAIDT